MNMKRNIFNFLHDGVLRAAVCTMVLSLPGTVFAQTDDEEEEVGEVVIKQPDRSKIKKDNYPTVTFKGVVNDQ